jgi:ligand-binding SRPBCC domain-containing protein
MLNILKIYELRRQAFIPAQIGDVFSFFSDAENLEGITPPWLNFRILTPHPIRMEKHALIDYSINLMGVPLTWKTEIATWKPPECFIDRQIKGPFRVWEHTHQFAELEGGTRMTDIVRYAVPGFIFSPLIHFFFVRPRLEKIFSFREKSILDRFGKPG